MHYDPLEGNRKYIGVFSLQGASRDMFLTNNLEPRPGRVELQVNIHEGLLASSGEKLTTR